MSTFNWEATQFEERWFHALACLLARVNQQQEAHDTDNFDEAQSDHDVEDSTDLDDEAETMSPRKIASSLGKKKLKKKFLDRLAEVMAREVEHDKKGDDVFATGTLEFKNQTVVYVARNEGLGEIHKQMIKKMQTWIRVVASTGDRRDISKDRMWCELVAWSLPRLEYYRDQLNSSFDSRRGSTLQKSATVINYKLAELQQHCTSLDTPSPDNSITVWTEIITLCFELKYESTLLPALEVSFDTNQSKLVWNSIVFMGRLRSAYETFIEFAMQFSAAKSVQILCLDGPVPLTLRAFGQTELSEKLATAGIDLDKLTIKEKRKRVKSKARKLEILKRDFEKPVRVHAEVQILMQLVSAQNDEKPGLKEFDYIGCSKKCCYLCGALLKGIYDFRGSHRKVYPRWTISSLSLLQSWPSLKLHSKVSETGFDMLKQLGSPTGSKLPYVAESTAGITTASATKAGHRHRRFLDKASQQSKRNASQTREDPVLGCELKKIDVLLIPGDGGIPRLVKVPIRATTKAYNSKDYIAWDVPDFGEFWEGQLNFDRNFRSLDVTNQESIEVGFEVMNGQYRAYFNCSEELPPNEYLKKAVIDGTIPTGRKFWNGDAFLVKLATRFVDPPDVVERTSAVPKRKKKMIEVEFDENAHTMYQNVPDCILRSQMIIRLFRKFWEEEQLEEQLKEDQEAEQIKFNAKNNKEIILARMTETEEKVLDLLPPNFIEILAMQHGDYGASSHHKITEDPTNPKMYRLFSEEKIDTLERMDWQGFSSEQL